MWQVLWARHLQGALLGGSGSGSWGCSLLRAWLSNIYFQANSCGCWQAPEDLLLHWLTWASHKAALLHGRWLLLEVSKPREGERKNTPWKPQSFYNLFPDSYLEYHNHFCHILFHMKGSTIKITLSLRCLNMNRWRGSPSPTPKLLLPA